MIYSERNPIMYQGEKLCRKRFTGEDFTKFDFSHANLRGAKFEMCTLRNADFSHANLHRAKFKQCELQEANFVQADLRGTRFNEGNLIKAELSHTDMRSVRFDKCDLSRSDFSNARLGVNKYRNVIKYAITSIAYNLTITIFCLPIVLLGILLFLGVQYISEDYFSINASTAESLSATVSVSATLVLLLIVAWKYARVKFFLFAMIIVFLIDAIGLGLFVLGARVTSGFTNETLLGVAAGVFQLFRTVVGVVVQVQIARWLMSRVNPRLRTWWESIRGSRFDECDLSYADFSFANCRGAGFHLAKSLDGTRWNDVTNLNHARFPDGFVITQRDSNRENPITSQYETDDGQNDLNQQNPNEQQPPIQSPSISIFSTNATDKNDNDKDKKIQKKSSIDRRSRRLLDKALVGAFSRFDLEKMIAYGFDMQLDEITERDNKRKVVFEVIKYFDHRDELEKLILFAYMERPKNAKLRELAEKHPYYGE